MDLWVFLKIISLTVCNYYIFHMNFYNIFNTNSRLFVWLILVNLFLWFSRFVISFVCCYFDEVWSHNIYCGFKLKLMVKNYCLWTLSVRYYFADFSWWFCNFWSIGHCPCYSYVVVFSTFAWHSNQKHLQRWILTSVLQLKRHPLFWNWYISGLNWGKVEWILEKVICLIFWN